MLFRLTGPRKGNDDREVMGREERGRGGGGRVSGAEESERKGKGGRGFRITSSAFFAASYVVVGASCLSERIPEKSKNPFISACYPKKKGRRREKSGFRSFTFCPVPRPTFFAATYSHSLSFEFPPLSPFSVLCSLQLLRLCERQFLSLSALPVPIAS